MAKKEPHGFVSLASLKHAAPDAREALTSIRRIYFSTTRQTIDADIAHAIELLKSLPSEDEREKATVYMEGLAQMRKEWAPRPTRGSSPPTARRKRRSGEKRKRDG